jgi:hypothetical protein
MLAGLALVILQTCGFDSLDSCLPEDYAQEVLSYYVVNFRQNAIFNETCDYATRNQQICK